MASKLVRDRISEIIAADGCQAAWHTAEDVEVILLLKEKLKEESKEFFDTEEIDELADILEVVYALVDEEGFTRQDLMDAYERKHAHRGGFAKHIVLENAE